MEKLKQTERSKKGRKETSSQILRSNLVAVLQQHPGGWELVDGVKIKSARRSKIWGFGDFLKQRKFVRLENNFVKQDKIVAF